MNNQKCRDCKYCKSTASRYATRLSYMCTHPYQKMILDYFREHRLYKMPGFIAYNVNSMAFPCMLYIMEGVSEVLKQRQLDRLINSGKALNE